MAKHLYAVLPGQGVAEGANYAHSEIYKRRVLVERTCPICQLKVVLEEVRIFDVRNIKIFDVLLSGIYVRSNSRMHAIFLR